MSIQTTYTNARENFAKLCDQAAEDREIVIISRRKAQDVALISADELSSLMETAYLLRSSNNAKRLLTALNRAQKKTLKSKTLKELKQEVQWELPESKGHG